MGMYEDRQALFGGSGGGSSSGYGAVPGGQQLSGQTYYADPNAAGGLIQNLIQSMGGQQQQFNQFMQNPAASPEFQQQMQGILAAQKPVLQQGAQQLSDIFRGAGNTSSSVFGQAANNFVGDQQRNTQDMLLKALNQIVQQHTAASLPQILQGPQLLEAMRLSKQYSNPSGGGNAGSSSGSISDPFGMLGNNANKSTSGQVGRQGSTQPNDYMQQLLLEMLKQQATPATRQPTQNPVIGIGNKSSGADQFGGQTADLTGTGYENQYDPYVGQVADLTGTGYEQQYVQPQGNNWVGSTGDSGFTYGE